MSLIKRETAGAGAIFDASLRYRYLLWRNLASSPTRPCLWIMLNPSTATETESDPTVEKCRRFSEQWGFDACRVVNIFAWRSTDPVVLPQLPDPIGPENNTVIDAEAMGAARIILAWGNWGRTLGRGREVRRRLAQHLGRTFALGINKTGEPEHPLYVPYRRKLIALEE